MQTLSALVFVGFGSMLGGLSRYGMTLATQNVSAFIIPWGTLISNLAGCLIIGLLAGLGAKTELMSSELRLLLASEGTTQNPFKFCGRDGVIDDGCGYGAGFIQVTASWDTGADIDLYVTGPLGDTLSFQRPSTPGGARVDHSGRGDCSGMPNPQIEPRQSTPLQRPPNRDPLLLQLQRNRDGHEGEHRRCHQGQTPEIVNGPPVQGKISGLLFELINVSKLKGVYAIKDEFV